MRDSSRIFKLVETAILMGVIIVLQLFASSIPIGAVSFSFVLVPIVLGGILAGPSAGALLGLTFGVMTMIDGLMALTPGGAFTQALILDHPIITVTLCIAKATLAGLCAALVYKALKKVNRLAAIFAACAIAPIVNTGIFIIGAFMMSDTLGAMASGSGKSLMYFIFIVLAGVNFLVELLVNVLFAPVLYSFTKISFIKKNHKDL